MGDEKQFTKNDMERMGIFKEMQYITIKDPYKNKGKSGSSFNDAAGKGKQMLPGGSKTRSALPSGYFKEFSRIMEGEAYTDPIKIRRQHRLKEQGKNIGKPFLPSSGEKKPSGLGNHYGTLSGPIQAFNPQGRGAKDSKSDKKNFYTNPGKCGTGFGYVGVTLNPYHKHASDPYDRAKELRRRDHDAHRKALKGGPFKLNMNPEAFFDRNPYRSDRPLPSGLRPDGGKKDVKPFKPSSPGKQPGGMKAGTFDPYPSHSNDHYKVLQFNRGPVHVVNKHGKIFMPSAGPKSAPVNSVLEQNVVKYVNNENYRGTRQVMSY